MAPNSEAPKPKSVAPSADPSRFGARLGSIHRVFVMRDSQSDEHYNYGFVEFWTLQDVHDAMYKCRLMGQQVDLVPHPSWVSPIHLGVFVPDARPLNPTVERQTFFPLFNPENRFRYRDFRVYPSPLVVTTAPPVEPEPEKSKQADAEPTDKVKKGTKRKGVPLVGNEKAKKSVPAAMAGQIALWQKKQKELKEGTNATPSQAKAAKKAFKQDGPIKFSIPSTLPTSTVAASAPDDPAPTEAADGDAKEEPPKEELFTDRDKLKCMICMMKYKSLDDILIHEASRKHLAALGNEELVKAALLRVAKNRPEQEPQADAEVQAPKYRDRAKDRRESEKLKQLAAQGKKATTGAKKGDADAPAKSAQSKGASMLAKMGWKAGGGLGASGEGRTEAITTNAYQQGVGLGAEGGLLGDAAEHAEKNTKGGYAGYVSDVKDKARERFQKLQQ